MNIQFGLNTYSYLSLGKIIMLWVMSYDLWWIMIIMNCHDFNNNFVKRKFKMYTTSMIINFGFSVHIFKNYNIEIVYIYSSRVLVTSPVYRKPKHLS